MDVSIIIVSFNGREYLRRCLSSIYQNKTDIAFEVIVVDNASTDGTPDLVRTEFPQAKLFVRGDNAGFSRAVNEGLAAAGGNYYLVLNPDSEITRDILSPMIDYLRQHPDIGLLGPKILDADGRLQLSCRSFPDFTTAFFNRYSPLTRLFPDNRYSSRYLMLNYDHARIADVDWMSGACWLLPRSAYETIGPLDESYFWTFEDVDYCQRAKRAGLRVVYFPDASVIHHIGGSSRSAPGRSIVARHQGMWRYYRAYMQPETPVVRPVVGALMVCAIGARCTLHLATGFVKQKLSHGED